jgi:hypothetical protein
MFTNPVHLTALVVVALADAVGMLFHGPVFRASPRAPEPLTRLLRPVLISLLLHYSFWYGWVLPAFSAPDEPDTGGVLLGMFLLIVEPAACALVALMLEAALWLRRQFKAGHRPGGASAPGLRRFSL